MREFRVLSSQVIQRRVDMLKHLSGGIAGHEAAVDLDLATVGHDVDSGPAADGSDVPGGVAEHRVGAGGQVGVEAAGERGQRLGHVLDGVVALLGHGAVGGDAVGSDAPTHGPLLGGDDLQLGRLAHHGRVDRRASFGHDLRTDHHDLFAHGAGQAEVHGEVGIRRRCLEDVQHGRHAALGIGRAAAVEAAVGDPRVEGVGHWVQADGVEVALEHQGGAVAAADPGQQVGAAGLDVVHLDVGAGGAGEVGDVVGQLGLAGAALEAAVDAVDGDQAGERFNDGCSDGQTSAVRADGGVWHTPDAGTPGVAKWGPRAQ